MKKKNGKVVLTPTTQPHTHTLVHTNTLLSLLCLVVVVVVGRLVVFYIYIYINIYFKYFVWYLLSYWSWTMLQNFYYYCHWCALNHTATTHTYTEENPPCPHTHTHWYTGVSSRYALHLFLGIFHPLVRLLDPLSQSTPSQPKKKTPHISHFYLCIFHCSLGRLKWNMEKWKNSRLKWNLR